MGKTGIVFKIQRYSIHDGPGIRTAVFLKGCPLECWWCHNPEGSRPAVQIIYHQDRCLLCGSCIRECRDHAITVRDNQIFRNTAICNDRLASVSEGSYTGCPDCAAACPAGALESVGQVMTVSQVMKEIIKDRPFFDESGGGATFTGGEPFSQFGFLYELLVNCKNEGIHTAIETSGYTQWDKLCAASAYTDLFLYDIKIIDNEKHKKYTGVSNMLIHDNLKKLSAVHENIHVRIPLIPGINDDIENIEKTCLLLNSAKISRVSLLPYHNTGVYKYARIGLEYKLPHIKSPKRHELEAIAERFANCGIKASIGA
jgi:pyruvate formate lyase activating enzyme